jgi:hypothetical protein
MINEFIIFFFFGVARQAFCGSLRHCDSGNSASYNFSKYKLLGEKSGNKKECWRAVYADLKYTSQRGEAVR